jgi:hypothetical protein
VWGARAGREPSGLAVAVVLVGLAALALTGCGASPSPADGARSGGQQSVSRSDPGEAAPDADAATRRAVAALLDDPAAGLGITTFDGLSRSVTSLRVCGRSDGRCEVAVLLTGDRWTSDVTHYLGLQDRLPWTQLLPDGAAALVPDDPDDAVVLHPDGSTTRLTVSTDPVPADRNSVLAGGLWLPEEDGGSFGELWVLDPASATVAPLATQPPGGDIGAALQRTGDGALVVLQGDPEHHTLATSTDGGRSWTTRRLPDASDGQAAVLADVVAGPGQRVALRYTYDGATVAPWRDLWLSDHLGRNWQHVPARHHPATVGGSAFGPDGTLLLTDDQQSRVWRVTADRNDLEPAPGTPAAVSLWRTGGVVVAEVDARTLSFIDDGVTWWTAAPGRRLSVQESTGGTPVPIDPGSRTTSGPPSPIGAPARRVPADAVARLEDAVQQLTKPVPGRPTARQARLVGYRVQRWSSRDDFTLLVTLVVRFPSGVTTPWNDGTNERFVTFTRPPTQGDYKLGWATSP